MPLTVYTAVTQDYDRLQPVAAVAQSGGSFVAFLETPQAIAPWEIRPMERQEADPLRDAKRYKLLPQQFFPQADVSLWLDGKMEVTTIRPLTDLLPYLGDADLAIFTHPLRYCLYDEACLCIHRHLDDPAIIYRQVQRYTREGFPAGYGLVDCAVLLRRHTRKMEEFCQLWWQEIQGGSRRDQLSFTYCAWKCGLKYRHLPGFTHDNPFFKRHLHKRPLPPPSQPFAGQSRSLETGVPDD